MLMPSFAGRLLDKHKASLQRSVTQAATLFLLAARSVTRKHIHVSTPEVSELDTASQETGPLPLRAASVLRTGLSDYFEMLSRFAVGPQKTVYFIYDCLH